MVKIVPKRTIGRPTRVELLRKRRESLKKDLVSTAKKAQKELLAGQPKKEPSRLAEVAIKAQEDMKKGPKDEFTGKAELISETVRPPTEEERIQAEMDAPFREQAATEEMLFGESTTGSTLEEELRRQADILTAQKERAERQAVAQRADLLEEGRQANVGIASAREAGTMAFAPGREGPVSASNISAQERFRTESQRQINTLSRRLDDAQAEVSDFLTLAEQAEREGKAQLAEDYRLRAAEAENTVRQIDTNYLNALSAASQEQRANFEAFGSLVDQGIELSTDALVNFSNQMGLDFQTVRDYYEGAQRIRDDKNLDQAEKEIELNNLAYDFDRKLRGIETEEAIKVDNYMKLVQSGNYSPEELEAFAVSMNIPNENNPVFMAELRLSEADAKIREAEANGEIVSPIDKLDYMTSLAEYNSAWGISPGYLPSGGAYTATQTEDGIRIAVEDGQSLDIPGTDRREDWCGAFVNDALGTSFGNTFEDKMKLVDPNIVAPEPGMAFVVSTAEIWGHVGIVESVDLATGRMTVVEANWQKGSDGKGIVSRRTMDITDAAGFVRPPNGIAFEQPGGSDFDTYVSEFRSMGFNQEEAREKALEKVEEDEQKRVSVLSQAEQNQIAINTINDIIEQINTGGLPETGLIGATISNIPGTQQFDIASQLDTVKAIVGFAKLQQMRDASKTGGALGQVSEKENELLQSVLGSLKIGQSKDQFLENLQQVKTSLENINNAAYQDYGMSVPGQTSESGEISEVESIINQYVQPSDGRDALYDEYLTPR